MDKSQKTSTTRQVLSEEKMVVLSAIPGIEFAEIPTVQPVQPTVPLAPNCLPWSSTEHVLAE